MTFLWTFFLAVYSTFLCDTDPIWMQHHTTFADVHFHCCQIVTLRTVNNYEYRILWWCYQHFPNFCKKCRDFVDCLPWFSCSSSGIACHDLSSEWHWLFHDYVPDRVVSSCGVSSFECLTSNVRDTVKHFNLAALKVGSLAPYILVNPNYTVPALD